MPLGPQPTSARSEPDVPAGRIVVRPPPELQPNDGASGILMNAIPMIGSVGSIVLVASMADVSGGRSHLAAGMFLFATVGFVVVQLDRHRKQRSRAVGGSRADYLHHLATVRAAARRAAEAQRRALTRQHPDPGHLPAVAAEGSRIWERSDGDEGWLQVRYAVGRLPLAVELVGPDGDTGERADPASVAALRRLLAAHREQSDLPVTLDLRAERRVVVSSATPDDPRPAALARSLLCAATAFHAPDRLLVAVLTTADRLPEWEWTKWLPHLRSPCRSDAVGGLRMVATSPTVLATLLPDGLGSDGTHLLLIADGTESAGLVPGESLSHVTVIDVPRSCGDPVAASAPHLRFTDPSTSDPTGPDLQVLRLRSEPVAVRADRCDLVTAEAFARRLAPLTPPGPGPAPATGTAADATDLLSLLGLADVPALDLAEAWRPRPERERLRVPIGLDEDGEVTHLDLKESAEQGMGPHGLVIGATGSGKSELLRTLVLGLCLTHAPDRLNLVLVDFKGGATFAGLSALPHVSAVITNLEEELTLVDRMQDALAGEMVRRQELLRAAGNHASARDYTAARDAGADLEPLPSLLIVVDEFSEMLSAKPEFIDLFVAIGRLGRSLGLHLLLASQRLEEGRLRGLESHLSYRIGLRTFSAQESRAVLGVPDAYELPAVPGTGYLRPDPTSMVRFRAAHVSAPPVLRTGVRRDEGPQPTQVLPFTLAEVPLPATGAPPTPSDTPAVETSPVDTRSLLDLAVSRMSGTGPPARQIWLPPLDAPETLGALLGDLQADPALGLVSRSWRTRGPLRIPVGIIDRPREQRRDVLTLDLSGSAGHLAVVGGPRSGKSTALRTVVAALSLTTTSQETQVFVLDFGGGTFAPFGRAPHVAGVGTRAHPEVVRRVLAEVSTVLDRREAHFRAEGIDGIESYRQRRRDGLSDDGYGDVFLVIDGWGTLRAEFEDLEQQVQQLATRGLTYGLHVLAAAGRWADFRSGMRDLFGTRLELRLGDPIDSEVSRSVAALVPEGRPGRGLVTDGLHALIALPRIDACSDPSSLGTGVDDLIARLSSACPDSGGPKLRLLPERIELEQIEPPTGPTGVLRLGVAERDLAPVTLDPTREPHLLVLGDGGSGKSSLLRLLAHEVVRTHTPRQAQLVVLDHRRSLLGEVPSSHLLHHLSTASQAHEALGDLAAYLTTRLPGPDVTPGELRARTWWQGADVFVLVDDHDLVTASSSAGSPLQALQPFLPRAVDVGLHLVVARRTGGASRALHEPILQTLRDLAAPGLLLSGRPDEGPLLGGLRPLPAPPGRGRLITRDHGVDVIQVAWRPPQS